MFWKRIVSGFLVFVLAITSPIFATDLPADFSDGNVLTAGELNNWKEERDGHVLPISPSSFNYETGNWDLGSSTFKWRDGWFFRNALVSANVGVGTTAPAFGEGTGIEILRSSAIATLRLNRTNTGASALELKADNAQAVIDSRTSSVPLVFKTVATERMRVDSSGRVAIGTTSPLGRLDVSYTGSSGQLSAVFGADTGGVATRTNATIKEARLGIPHYTNAEEPAALVTGTSTSIANNIFIGGGTSVVNAATLIAFYTAANNTTITGTEKMRIQGDGNVGVGTTAPTQLFSVAEKVRIRSSGIIDYDSSVNGILNSASTMRINIDSDNNSTTEKFVIGRNQDSASVGNEIMTIQEDGNIGIGLTNPSEVFQVAGNARVSGHYKVAANQVVGARITGWAAATGTANRTTFATGTVTTEQLAQRLKALIDDLTTHGLIGN